MRTSRVLLAASALFAGSLVRAANIDVTVGKGGQLQFVPESLVAQVGDTITYSFFSKNHSVTQSSFAQPCQPLEGGGFFSGFTATTSPDVAALTTFTITVNDTTPIWVYCGQVTGNHCQNGMVHSINAPPTGNTIDAFKAKAKTAATSTSPANGLPVGGSRILHVQVGANGKTFTPNNVTELVGTVVEYSFFPMKHTVTQSSFDKPCQPLDGGFSSGFIPTTVSPSGVLFDIVIKDTKPIWFYCGQTNGEHCQSGMVGSINAAPTGDKTFQAFKDLAASAPPSTIPPNAPLGGVLSVNGTVIPTLNGNVLNITPWGDDYITQVPPPGDNNQYMMGLAGGGVVANYSWGSSITDETVRELQLLQWLDNILLDALLKGVAKLDGGDWNGVYPKTIVDTLGSMTAQAYVHRSTATDTLQHFHKDIVEMCKYELPMFTIDSFVHLVLSVLLLEIGLLLDIITKVATTDSWLVPAIASTLGAKSRMSGVVNLIQNHIVAAAPREVAIPSEFVYSYASSNYVSSCPTELKGWPAALPPLEVTERVTQPSTNRLETIRISFDKKQNEHGQLYVAFLGPWGATQFSPLSNDGLATVPSDLYGHVWIVLTKAKDVALGDLYSKSLAGPELVWISQP